MNIEIGFKSIFHNPFILIIPIALQVLLSFLLGLGVLFGVDLQSVISLANDSSVNSDVVFQFTLPVIIPLIADMNQSLTFLPSFGNPDWKILAIVFLLVQVIQSFGIAMYLGSLKKVIIPSSHRNQSVFVLGIYFFKRIFIFQLIYAFIMLLVLYTFFSWLLVGILLALILLVFTLTPYIIVLEDKSIADAIMDAPRYFKKYFVKFLPLALGAFITTGLLSFVLFRGNDASTYYLSMIFYTFIGSGFIAAFLNLLYQCIQSEEIARNIDEQYVLSQQPWQKIIALIFILLLPWIGVQFAKGKHVLAVPIHDSISYSEGISFWSNWSEAFYGSDYQVVTYSFDDNHAFQMTMALADYNLNEDKIRGRGNLTWKVDQKKITQRGSTTYHERREVITETDFMYELHLVHNQGKPYYTSTNGGYAKLINIDQVIEPTSMEVFLMNDGNDLFVVQYKDRFDPYDVMRVEQNGEYFIPLTSEYNPEDFKYFWYSEQPMTIDRLRDFLHAKNKELLDIGGGPDLYNYEYIVATFLQEGDGTSLMRFADESAQEKVQTNLSELTATEWSDLIQELYGEVDLETFISYLNRTNTYDAYERKGWTDTDLNEYQLIVPFPMGEIVLNCIREEGVLVSLEVEWPEVSMD